MTDEAARAASESAGASRRSILRSAGIAAGAVFANGLASTSRATASRSRPEDSAGTGGYVACDGATETTTRTGSIPDSEGADTLSYDAKTNDPCQIELALSSADATDIDLYVTLDGRTPSTTDYDRRSKASLTSDESITLEEGVVDANTNLGVLVDSYTAGGSWTLDVTETATGGGGENQPPAASFTASSATVGVDETIEFDASASSDGDGSVSSYAWEFGDGTTATGTTTTHAYDAAGSYTVTLTVTDDDGATDVASTDVTVEAGGECGVTKTRTETGTLGGYADADEYAYAARTRTPCEVTLSLTADSGTDYDLYVTYDGRTPTTSDYDDRAYNYGSDEELVVDGSNVPANGDLGLLVDSYDGSGDYTFTIEEVGTGDGGTDPEPNDPPAASFTASDTTVGVGDVVDFDASASNDGDGSITGYEWTFGDGASATGPTPSHSYDTAGTYTVTVTVTDDDGASDDATTAVTVESGGECGATEATGSREGSFWWFFDESDELSYDTQTASPCEATVSLDGPADADFDLYVTTDGRTPTRDDYDARSAGDGATESVTVDGIDANASLGVLVYRNDGSGSYTVDIQELGA